MKVRPTRITKNDKDREILVKALKQYEQGKLKSLEDVRRSFMSVSGKKVSIRTIKSSIAWLKEQKDGYRAIEEEVRIEKGKRFAHLLICVNKRAQKYTSPIPEMQKIINRFLHQKSLNTRYAYARLWSRAWEFIVRQTGLYDPSAWGKDDIDLYIYSDKVGSYKKSTQNRIRTAVNQLMKELGRRDIFYRKQEEEKPAPVYLHIENRRKIFKAVYDPIITHMHLLFDCMFTLAIKQGNRIGSTTYRDPNKPENDRDTMGIRINQIFLDEKPVRMIIRAKRDVVWVKYLDEEGAKVLKEYLAWRKKQKEWKNSPFLFPITHSKVAQTIRKIRRIYSVYELDQFGRKRDFTFHLFRDTFANEALEAFSGGDPEKTDRGILACCELGGWKDPKTFKERYVSAETMLRLKKKWLKQIEGKINVGRG